MKKLILSLFFSLFIPTIVFAATDTLLMKNEHGSLVQRKENNHYELVLISNAIPTVLQTYSAPEDISAYLYKNIIIYNGRDALRLYLYDLDKKASYLLNANTLGGDADIFYYNFNAQNNKLYIFLGVDSSGMSKFCIYDLEKLASLSKNYDLNQQLQSYVGKDEENLYSFTKEQSASFCTLDQPGDYFGFKWLNNDKISFIWSNVPQENSSIEIIYEANSDGSNLKQTGVLIGDKEITDLFKDLSINDPLFETVYTAKAEGWVSGYPDGTIRPQNPINRAEFAKMVILAFGKELLPIPSGTTNVFPDAPANLWYSPTLYTALKLNLMSGYPDGTAKPERTVNKVEALKIVLNMLGRQYIEIEPQYKDTESNQWYSKYTAFSYSQEPSLLPSDDVGNLNPAKELTRGEAIELITRVLRLR